MRSTAVVAVVLLAVCAEASLHRMVRQPKGNVPLPQSDSKYWKDLGPKERNGALALGYTEQMWNSNGFPPSDDKRWNTLTAAEQNGALALGYGKKLWNHELDSRAKLPPGGEKVEDAVKAADKIMNAIDDHLTQHRAKQNPSGPEAHDASMQAEIDGKKNPSGPEAHDARMEAEMEAHGKKTDAPAETDAQKDSPQAHDARMEAEMEAHGKKTEAPDGLPAAKQETAAVSVDPTDAAPFHGQIDRMHPEIVQIWKKAKALFANIPEKSASFTRGKEVFHQIKDAVVASIKKAEADNKDYPNGASPTSKDPAATNAKLDQWLTKGKKITTTKRYVPAATGTLTVTVKKMPISPPIMQPNGVPMPMEQVNKQLEAPAKNSEAPAKNSVPNHYVPHKVAEAPGKSAGDTRFPNPNVPKAEREASRAHLENAASSLARPTDPLDSAPSPPPAAPPSLQQDSQGLVRKISQYEDDRTTLVKGNKEVISKINGFFSDNSVNAALPARVGVNSNHPNDAVRQAAEAKVVAKTDAKVAAHEATPGVKSEAHEAAPGIESEAPASSISDGEHVAGDETMTQGELPLNHPLTKRQDQPPTAP